jgi:hypothetical protein
MLKEDVAIAFEELIQNESRPDLPACACVLERPASQILAIQCDQIESNQFRIVTVIAVGRSSNTARPLALVTMA